MRRIVAIVAVFCGLAGCNGWPIGTENTIPESNTPEKSRELQCPVVLQRTTGSDKPGEVAALLHFRQQQCARPVAEREALLKSFLDDTSKPAVLRRLMLATCVPDQTPGLLANALVAARNLESRSPELDTLLALLSAEAESYALLERRLKNTQKKLDDMIRGIRAIEAEMGESQEQP